jgi:ribosome-binding protein aMBF1 (putative translation factor)
MVSYVGQTKRRSSAAKLASKIRKKKQQVAPTERGIKAIKARRQRRVALMKLGLKTLEKARKKKKQSSSSSSQNGPRKRSGGK